MKLYSQKYLYHTLVCVKFLRDIKVFERQIFKKRSSLLLLLLLFYGISTIVGYLMSNPFLYIYIKYMISKNIL